ncbi:MAG: tetratricopeptide repeat protein [Proteobacteria bacterium]|nr:tetratricopeptide repeat protein [Pseudomonadota bacterium]
MKGQIRKAIQEYERLVSDDPRNIRLRTKLADLYARNNGVDRAVEEYVQLAKQYEDEDLNYRAISMYKKVLTVRPKMIDVHYWLADLYKKESLFGNAKVLYQNIIKLNPEDQLARNAIKDINQAMAVANPVPGENDTLSSSLSATDHQPMVEEPLDLDDLLDIEEPSSEQIVHGEEILDLEDPVELPPDDTVRNEGAQQSSGNGPHLTHQKVDIGQNLSPEKDLESHYHLGIAYMEMDLIDKAIAEFEAAVEYAPKQVDCLVMLGRCYTEKGLFDRSIFYLEKALQSNDLKKEEHITINRQLAQAYEACGMKDKAGEAFKRAGLSGNLDTVKG